MPGTLSANAGTVITATTRSRLTSIVSFFMTGTPFSGPAGPGWGPQSSEDRASDRRRSLARIRGLKIRQRLERAEERDEIALLRRGQSQGETLVVEVDDVEQRGRRAIVEVRRAAG